MGRRLTNDDIDEILSNMDFCEHEKDEDEGLCVENCGLPLECQIDSIIDDIQGEIDINNYLNSRDY